jgi:hypothetical protein
VEANSVAGLVLAGLGSVLAVMSRHREGWLLVAFPIAFTVFIASLNLRWDRWIIPVIPFLCLLAAHALYRTATWIQAHHNPRMGVLAGCLLLATAVPSMLRSDIVQGREMTGTDTRTLARDWIMQHVPAGSRVLLERYTPQFTADQYKLFVVDRGGQLTAVNTNTAVANALILPSGRAGWLKDTEAIHHNRIEYMVLSGWYERFRAESKDYTEIVATYEGLMRMGTPAYEVQRTPGINTGPTIRVYRFDRAGTGLGSESHSP